MITGLDHIAIAVRDLETAAALWVNAMQAEVVHRERVEEQKVDTLMLIVGGIRIELLSPVSEDSPISRFLATRGPGIHHIALKTDSAAGEIERMRNDAVRLLDETPRTGAAGSLIAFLHPRALDGVLVEIVEPGES